MLNNSPNPYFEQKEEASRLPMVLILFFWFIIVCGSNKRYGFGGLFVSNYDAFQTSNTVENRELPRLFPVSENNM